VPENRFWTMSIEDAGMMLAGYPTLESAKESLMVRPENAETAINTENSLA
jgi:hypothetical protein